MRPGDCSEDSTKDVAQKTKSNPRDEVPPRAEVEEVHVEPVLYHFVFLHFCMIFICIAAYKWKLNQVPVTGRMIRTTKKNGRDTLAIQKLVWKPKQVNQEYI